MTKLAIHSAQFEPPLFPIFLNLTGCCCLVVGATGLAEPKIESLLASGAEVVIVATRATLRVEQWVRQGRVKWHARRFEARDLHNVFLVVTATSSLSTNQAVFDAASARGILCNAVDDKRHCNFFYPAVVRRRRLQIAISTGGASPALAQRLRRELEKQFGPEYEVWLDWLDERRNLLFSHCSSPRRRRVLLHQIATQQSLNKFLRKQRTSIRAKGRK